MRDCDLNQVYYAPNHGDFFFQEKMRHETKTWYKVI